MKEKLAWIGGSHRRHLFYINQIAKYGCMDFVGGIMEQREELIPVAPVGLSVGDKENWDTHFQNRAQMERYACGDQTPPDGVMKVDGYSLNTNETADYMEKLNPDVVLVFGCGMIREPLLSSLPKDTINLHLGISPRYRGAATLFWPFYMMEPTWAGTTFHYLKDSPDAGGIIHQVRPSLKEHDTIHHVGMRAVLKSAVEAVVLLSMHARGWETFSQKPEAGKNFLEKDFKAQHLRVNYDLYGDHMVDAYLEGRLKCTEPKLKRQFP
jgi:hypothetical protein